MKKRFLLPLALFMLGFALIVSGCGDTTPDKETIAIAKTPYSNDWIPTHIIQHVAEELGYNTKLVEGDLGFLFLGLSQGDIDVYPAIWLPTLHKSYMEKYQGKIEITGTVYEQAAMGLAVPTYVNINSISDLKGRGDEFGKRIVGIEPSAGLMLTAEDVLNAYDIKDEYELLESSTLAMLSEVEQATLNKAPVLFLAWRPVTVK